LSLYCPPPPPGVVYPPAAPPVPPTASYAPPERIRGGRASPAGNLYSLGVVLYEMLTGRPPFLADNAEQLLRAHLEAATRPVRSLVFWGAAGDRRCLRGGVGQGPSRAADVGGGAGRPATVRCSGCAGVRGRILA